MVSKKAIEAIKKQTEKIENMSKEELLEYCDKMGIISEDELKDIYQSAFEAYDDVLYLLNIGGRYIITVLDNNSKSAIEYDEDEEFVSFIHGRKFSCAVIKESDIGRLSIYNEFPNTYDWDDAKKITRKDVYKNYIFRDV